MNYQDYRKDITNKIIKMVKEGTAPWQKSWNPGKLEASELMPHNAISEKRYRGANIINLYMEQIDRCSDDPRWCTFKQIRDKGWHLKKGSKGAQIEFWSVKNKEGINPETKEKETKKVMIARYYTVFNGQDIEGMPKLAKREQPKEWEPNKEAEKILQNSKAKIYHDQINRNFYAPVKDSIHLVPKIEYEKPEDYYAVAMHELSHWTGHPTRMERIDPSQRATKLEYAKEEIRAEMSSLYITMELGLPFKPSANTAPYVKSWLSALADDSNEFFKASAQAEKIADYVLEFGKEKNLENVIKESLSKEQIDRVEEIKNFVDVSKKITVDGFYKENAKMVMSGEYKGEWNKDIDMKVIALMMKEDLPQQPMINSVIKNSPEFPDRRQVLENIKTIGNDREFGKEKNRYTAMKFVR